jgi:glycine/D-amino acid oxidase-like deaminating enzyme
MSEREYDYIIVGQGVGGTLLSWFLHERKKTHLVIDNDHYQAASKIAAGVINPITGRKYVKSWRIEELLPFARETYQAISKYINEKIYHDKLIYRGLYSIKDENTWETRKADPVAGQFIVDEPSTEEFDDKVNGIFAYGVLKQGMQVQLGKLVVAYRKILENQNAILSEKFDYAQLEITNSGVKYKDVKAAKIIFAEGYQAQFNPYFKHLAFEPAKGDVLIIKVQGRPFDNILRHKVFVCPIDEEHYWVGSGYRWTFDDDAPDEEKGQELRDKLDEILNVPYEVVDHIAGIRPCVKGRRPFLGRHSEYPNLVIFNGLGTKGASLGPYWANHLIQHLEEDTEIDYEVLVS